MQESLDEGTLVELSMKRSRVGSRATCKKVTCVLCFHKAKSSLPGRLIWMCIGVFRLSLVG